MLKATVEGMTCGGCAASIERALKKNAKVSSASVDLKGKLASVEGELSPTELSELITKLGFKVTAVS